MEVTINCDGGSRGNPGPAAFGVVIKNGETVVEKIGGYLGIQTNNFAEYTAVVEALLWAEKNKSSLALTKISFQLDSQLIVYQMNGQYKVKHPNIIPFYQQIQQLKQSLTIPITFSHIPREKNKEADAIVNQVLDTTSA
jgi:ribonuclease HI